MFEWIAVSGDPYGTLRMSLIESFVVAFIIFYVLWYGLFRLIRWKLGTEADAFGKRFGFNDYSDFSFQFTRQTIAVVCVFLSWVFIIYMYTQQADIKATLQCASEHSLVNQCNSLGGVLACIPNPMNPMNTSLFNYSFPELPMGNPIVNGNQTNQNISR